MFETVEDIFIKFNLVKDELISESIEKNPLIQNYILSLFNDDKIDYDTIDEWKLCCNGLYFQYKQKDYELMKKYYLMTIEKNNSYAKFNLGKYYQKIEKDYVQMKKYYLMAIEKGNNNAMNNLGFYYKKIEKDYNLMKKYYLMAIEKGNLKAMNNLATYYQKIEKDYDLMKKYYQMAIEKDNSKAMYYLSLYYEKNKLDFYKELINIKNKNELITNKIKELENIKEIKIYNNKKLLFENLKNYKKCALCLEDNVLNIDLNCGHDICVECYTNDLKCIYNFCNC
jgi:TPR repeat protein